MLKGRTVLITGAAQGQGEAEARRAAAEGARVLLTDVSTTGAEFVLDGGMTAGIPITVGEPA